MVHGTSDLKGIKMARWRRRIGFERLEARHMLSHILADGEAPAVHVEIADLAVPVSAVEFTAPIQISEGQGLRGAEVRLSYDPTLLSADRSSVQAGSIWPTHDTMMFANVDDDNGTIVAWLFRTEELDAGSGSLLDVVFRTTEAVDPDVTMALDLISVRLNEDSIRVAETPRPADDDTDGVVRFTGQSSLDGTAPVLLDNGANSAPRDAFFAPPVMAPNVSNVEAGGSPRLLRGETEAEPRAGADIERIMPVHRSRSNAPAPPPVAPPVPTPVAPQTIHQHSQRISPVDPAQKSMAFQALGYATCASTDELACAPATLPASRPDRGDLSAGGVPGAERVFDTPDPLALSGHSFRDRQIANLRRFIGPSPDAPGAPGALLPTSTLDHVLQHTRSWLPESP
jgi:hypothetical protein